MNLLCMNILFVYEFTVYEYTFLSVHEYTFCICIKFTLTHRTQNDRCDVITARRI